MDQPYLDTVIYDNFYEMLRGRYEDGGSKTALRYFAGEETAEISYREMVRQVACVYFFLKKRGLSGKHIGILSENRYEYIILYLAAVFDCVVVPLDKELDTETLGACAARFDVEILFCTEKTLKKAKAVLPEERLLNIDRLFSQIIVQQEPVEDFFRAVEHTDRHRFAVLACTSGTDGRMKGVMLSQYNVITNIRGTLENNVLKNPTLSFLPMNHTYGFHPCVLATLYNGTTLCLNLELKHLRRDLKAFDPYFFGAVPMVIEGIYDNILREVKRQKKEKAFRRLIRISNILYRCGIDLRHVFFGKLVNPSLRLVVNGGAALNGELVERFRELGIELLNGYGLTECSPTVAVSRVCNNVAGSAGTVMKHIEVKTAEDGEILVKGPCVMLGYYKDEAATQAVMRDGYLATGDTGYTDGKVLFVTGRKKNLIILENGKNVAPEYLEGKINRLPYIQDSLVVPARTAGKNRILKALVVLKEGMDGSSFAEDLKELNSTLPLYMRLEDYEILPEDFQRNSSRKILRRQYTG
ncbi:MAG: AMP-binding protein [Lachnospiraceae bacterium]|nr:AMP-binding protein [Lachnospiraceae bacterium]